MYVHNGFRAARLYCNSARILVDGFGTAAGGCEVGEKALSSLLVGVQITIPLRNVCHPVLAR